MAVVMVMGARDQQMSSHLWTDVFHLCTNLSLVAAKRALSGSPKLRRHFGL